MKKLILLSFLALISCKDSTIDYNYPDSSENVRKQRAGKFFENSNPFNNKKTLDQNAVEKVEKKPSSPLWLSSIEVISALLPIATADENSGLIITEWYQDGQNQNGRQGSRIKINLLVKGKEAVKENLVLTIFRQTKDSKGAWIDEQSSNQSISAQMIKDKIIEKTKSK
jgi:hypothetical protein